VFSYPGDRPPVVPVTSAGKDDSCRARRLRIDRASPSLCPRRSRPSLLSHQRQPRHGVDRQKVWPA